MHTLLSFERIINFQSTLASNGLANIFKDKKVKCMYLSTFDILIKLSDVEIAAKNRISQEVIGILNC